MRILVTGGAGFIGSHVAEAALAAGHDVAVLDNLSRGKREHVPSGVRLFEVDLRDKLETERAVRSFAPDAVSHHAAQASVGVSLNDPALDLAINVTGSLHLLEACIRQRVSRLVFASSGGAIYGEVPRGVATEATPPNPQNPYGVNKLSVELLLEVYRREHGLQNVSLRYANVYGPRQNAHGEAGVVAVFFARALCGEPLSIHARKQRGDAGCLRDYVFVSDVARLNLLALEGRLPKRLLNVATATATTTLDLAEAVRRTTLEFSPDAPPTRFEFTDPRRGDLERSALDSSACELALGGLVLLEEGLRRTAASLSR